MKNILILGASGLIGRVLYNKFTESGEYNVIGTRRSVVGVKKEKNGTLIHWDIYDNPEETVVDLSIDYDCIIVNAWNGNQKDKLHNLDVNKGCAERIYAFLKYICAKCRVEQVILCGSQAEYGKISGIVTEESWVDEKTLNAYASAKLYLYRLLLEASFCDVVTELRFHSVFGYEKDSSQMILMVISNLLKKEAVSLVSDCRQKYNFLYVEDAADAIVETVRKKIKGSFNVGSNEDCILREYVTRIGAVLNRIEFVKFGEESSLPGFGFDSRKFRNATGWCDKYSFEDGIKKVVSDIKKEIKNE